jgi:metal-responsive CopG/Arc/MetJ family transcriptional regulator
LHGSESTFGNCRPGESWAIPILRVNLDVIASMLEELDRAAQDLNVSRQAVIKTLVRQALDQHYLAQRARS